MFLRTTVTDRIKNKATNWSSFNGNNFSIRTDGKNRFAGNLAEIVFSESYPSAIRISDTDKNADFILKGKRIDVKCKDRTVFCKDYYEVSIEQRQLDFNVDWYAFYSFNRNENIIEFLGWISKDDYIKKSTKLKKGTIDHSNGWTVNVDCANLKISELINVSKNDSNK